MVIITTMNDRPLPKDSMTAVITVSTVLLALTPVFLAIQQTHPTVLHPTLIVLYAILALSFFFGLVAIALAVDWFDKPIAWRKLWAKRFLIYQTMAFTFGSFILLGLTLLSN